MKILLLEDNMKLNQTIVKRLSLKGYKVDAYLDGLEAYYAIDEGYACFILDINVPSLDGVKLLKRVREYYDEVPVIIISASVELDIIKEAYDFGCNDYLKKPFLLMNLKSRLISCVKSMITLFTLMKSAILTLNPVYFLVIKKSNVLQKKRDCF